MTLTSGWRLVSIIAGIVLGFIVIMKILSVYAEWLWFDSVGYASVYTKILITRCILFVVTFPLFWALLYLPWRYIRQIPAPSMARKWTLEPEEREVLEQAVDRGVLFISLIAALIAGFYVSHRWLTALQFFAPTPVGMSDPIFNKPIEFYLFRWPLLMMVTSLLSVGLSLSIAGAIVLLIFDDHIRFTDAGTEMEPPAVRILALMGAAWFIIAAIGTRLSMFRILYSMRGRVYGAGFADVYALLPGLWVLLVAFIVAGLFLLFIARRGDSRPLLWSVGSVLVLSFIARMVVPALVQTFVVKPNELDLERRFLKYNIELTRFAYNLDKFTERSYSVEPILDGDMLKRHYLTLSNVRLWDHRPLKRTYEQLQSIRPYYSFIGVDMDRYTINGQLRQVAIAARELIQHLEARTWVNDHLKYTHGYGIVMSPVNEATEDGSPRFYIKDIPPVSGIGLRVRRPEIYYGELRQPPPLRLTPVRTPAAPQPPQESIGGDEGAEQPQAEAETEEETPEESEQPPQRKGGEVPVPRRKRPPMPEYIIVKTTEREFDYPGEEGPVFCTYKGSGGVPIKGLLRRIAFAARFTDLMLLFTGAITKDSRIIMHRRILERVRTIAPFLLFDINPYIVLSDNGRLYWMVDAYTATPFFPYATPDVIDPKRVRYIRNSVKITVDAYNGTVDFYVIEDPERPDPLIRTYQKIFPKLFKPFSAMPEDLKRHIRYPRRLFYTQALMHTHYHMTAPEQFYNMEDVWEIPKERFAGKEQLVEPYYVVMKLPGEDRERFMLMLPFTPRQKSNMIAWMAAHCDPDDYGKMTVFRFPKGRLIFGPIQVEARIDQDPRISEYLTLWSQRGSQVIRGNLLVIPVAASVLYVEPLYLQAEQNQIPQLKKVIVASSKRVVMANNLWDALEQLLRAGGDKGGTTTLALQQEQIKTASSGAKEPTDRYIQQLIDRVWSHIQQFERARRDGDWAGMEREWSSIKRILRQLRSSARKGS